ncbi:hypothetical protein Nepgr_031816 [Nepenthes gracilis]|uniref:F-box domain-containing protein n=1 Tax=Nepenthes gracilis TaxID=150966 RepID=A0AAD3THF7_NEPGR|nr:hypothetical protein Nepgr_031816 [Nepenthes gracilis]
MTLSHPVAAALLRTNPIVKRRSGFASLVHQTCTKHAIMSALPEELWRRILEIGVERSNLSYKDLCCLSISCRRFHRLSDEDSLWSSLLSSDFPQHNNSDPSFLSTSRSSSSKTLYKIRYEKDRTRKLAAHRRAVLRSESVIAQHSRKLQELQIQRKKETQKIEAAALELLNLRKARLASVAMKVWQPEVIQGRQKQIVEQYAVPVDSRINALEMEVKLCKQQIVVFDKAHRDGMQRLEVAKEQLLAMEYHPLRDYSAIVYVSALFRSLSAPSYIEMVVKFDCSGDC